MAFTYVTLTAGEGFRDATGAVASPARIRATPAVDMTNGVEVYSGEVILPLDSDGVATKTLAATTDPGTLPTGNYYNFRVEVAHQTVRSFAAELSHNSGSTIDLSDLTELVSPPNLTASYSLAVVTQAAYNALASPDAHTLYVVIG